MSTQNIKFEFSVDVQVCDWHKAFNAHPACDQIKDTVVLWSVRKSLFPTFKPGDTEACVVSQSPITKKWHLVSHPPLKGGGEPKNDKEYIEFWREAWSSERIKFGKAVQEAYRTGFNKTEAMLQKIVQESGDDLTTARDVLKSVLDALKKDEYRKTSG